MTHEELITDIRKAYSDLAHSREEHLSNTQRLAERKALLADAKLLLMPEALGQGNESKREFYVYSRTIHVVAALRAAERDHRISAMILERDEDRVSELRLIAGLMCRGPF